MEHELKAAADYARCSQIWQRVAPDLDPYPSDSPAPLPAAPSPPTCPAMQLELLRRFIAGELESRCAFLRCARCAPSAAARRAMQLFAREEGEHARRLQSVHYLLTGSCFPPPAVQVTAPLPWREALRTRWYAARCAALAYRRAAEETEDETLAAVFRALADDEARRADRILQLLEQSLA